MTGFEPATSWSRTKRHPVASADSKGLAATLESACPNACPSERENAHAADAGSRQDKHAEGDDGTPVDLLATLADAAGSDLDGLADELCRRLTAEDCCRLAALLLKEEMKNS